MFSDLFASACRGHSCRKKGQEDEARQSQYFHPVTLSPLPEEVVSKGNYNQARVGITHFVGVNKNYFLPFCLKKVSKKLQNTANKVPT